MDGCRWLLAAFHAMKGVLILSNGCLLTISIYIQDLYMNVFVIYKVIVLLKVTGTFRTTDTNFIVHVISKIPA